uniref:Uncharacterized protein n=3 Tax=Oryza TaxID=4527 RepID=Q6ZKC8_ORYSJ|nr:hypothetical protein [Oryza sativa Japonica Group]
MAAGLEWFWWRRPVVLAAATVAASSGGREAGWSCAGMQGDGTRPAHGRRMRWTGVSTTAIAREEARKEVTGNGEEGERRPHAGMVGCGRQRRREQFDGCGARPEADTARGGADDGDGGRHGARRCHRWQRRPAQHVEARSAGGGGWRGTQRLTGGESRCSEAHAPVEA